MINSSQPLRPVLPVLRGREVLLVLLAGLGGMVLLAVAGLVLGLVVVGDRYAFVLAVLLGAVGAWSGLWLTLWRRHSWGWRELGFVRGRGQMQHLLWQVPAAMAASLVGAVLLGTALGLAPDQGRSTDQDLVDAAALSPWLLLVVAVCAVLVLPAAEEVVFRRVLLDWCLARLPATLAVLLTAVAFAAVHLAPAAMAYVVFIGIFTALLRLHYDNLWAPLALHVVNNGTVVLLVVHRL
jgi:membrane protease YdiL (CAAX protease family)